MAPPKLPPKPDTSAGKVNFDSSVGTVVPGVLTDTREVGSETGTGGFEIDGELQALDPGASDNRSTYGTYSTGDVHVDNTQKDISKVTRRTLGKYLGRLTSTNEYPVDSDDQVDISTTSDKGLPSRLTPSSNSSQFNVSPPSSLSPDAANISGFRKGRSDPLTDIDGNRLLPGAVENDSNTLSDASPIKKYTSSILAKNRFNSENVMPSSQLRRYKHVKTALGKYDPPDGVGSEDVSFDRMAQIGPTLSLRSGVELLSGNDGFNPSSLKAEAGALLPGVAQLGLRRIDTQMLLASDVLDQLYRDEADAATTSPFDPSSLSWGSMNNVSDQFSGASAFGMAALSAALVVGVEVVIDLLASILGGAGKGRSPTRDAHGRYALGAYMNGKKPKNTNSIAGVIAAALPPDLTSLLGLTPTRSDYNACVRTGLKAFFGIESSGGFLSTVAGAAAAGAMSENPGFNVVVCRSIIRSGVTIIESIKRIGGNPVSIAKGIVGMLDILKSSKIIAAINVFAQLGDRLLNTPDQWIDGEAEGNKVSSIDAEQDTNAVRKSRLKGTLKLAWAGNRAPSVMLMPKAIIAMRGKEGTSDSPSFGLTSFDIHSRHKVKANDSRLSPDEVDRIEQELDAEYVPFSFHDLRTNEIISFHAFLESINDDYTANYEQTEGYGRVDPIKIYRSTSRKIGVSFNVIATSAADFDDMWMKLNKLTTLVYPQYTAGRMITNGNDYTIRQPFSQLISASPMIRLRLGDLFKSNYSKFALARLFGMGDPGVTVAGKSIGNLEKFDDELINNVKNEVERSKGVSDTEFRYHVDGTGYPLSRDARGTSLSTITSSEKSSYNSETYLGSELPYDLLQIKVVVGNTGKGVIVGEVEWNPDAMARYNVGSPSALDAYKKIYGEEAPDGSRRLITGQYEFPVSALYPTQGSINRAIANKLPDADAEYVSAFAEFMNDTDSSRGNAIARSFRSTAGKGLAGFIDSMNMDWFTHSSWEVSPDRAAPQMCKITIAFSPVHDISPGIDASGFNRAPIYPVGPMSPRRIKR
jgi:hypothetical protein